MALLHLYPARLATAASCAVVALFAGCASVPRESVELSAAVGQDLEALHAAHKALAIRYFQRMHSDVDRFVDQVYRPYLIQRTMRDLDLVGELQAALQPGAKLDPVGVLQIYLEGTTRQIEAYRAELQAPVSQQEQQVLTGIDAAHLRIQNANAIVTGHLASIRKVHNAQDEFLRRARLGDARAGTIEIVTTTSDDLSKALETVEGEVGFKGLPERIREILKNIKPEASVPSNASQRPTSGSTPSGGDDE